MSRDHSCESRHTHGQESDRHRIRTAGGPRNPWWSWPEPPRPLPAPARLRVKPRLTEAQQQVLDHLGDDVTLVELAAQLGITLNTLKVHTATIYRKLGVHSRAEAAAVGAA